MQKQLAHILGTPILQYRALSGGDISAVYWIKTAAQELVVKVNTVEHLPLLLAAERTGLTVLAATGTIAVPAVHDYQQIGKHEYLVMEYVPHRPAREADYQQLASALAQLHQQTAPYFGAEESNYIGTLPQGNTPATDWSTFYVRERLLPQLRLAVDQKYLSSPPSESLLEHRCKELLGNPSPSPLHGDLWGGNYLIDTNGKPYLIDPSFYYGHREVDLAMSRLFGGFGPAFYHSYHEIFPSLPGEEERRDIYQLYYLLVHLNMFGLGYQGSVLRILRHYF